MKNRSLSGISVEFAGILCDAQLILFSDKIYIFVT